MEIIQTFDEYIHHANRIAKAAKGKKVRISSYGLFLGICSNGFDMQSNDDDKTECRKIFEYLNRHGPTKCLVGWTQFEGNPGCKFCIANNQKKSKYLENHKAAFPNISMKIVGECHLKLFSSEKEAIVGGMNLTGSGYFDLSFVIKNKSEVAKINECFDSIYLSAKANVIGIVDRFTFGKYKGELISDIQKSDQGYIDWCKSSGALSL